MAETIFYSWQSDTRAASCRTLIQEALDSSVRDPSEDEAIKVDLVVDRDTANVPGAPDIGATIFAKIDASAAFVADITTGVIAESGRLPNPNVLIELGYAAKAVGWDRIVLVQNTFFGPIEELPFDLRQKRVIAFQSAPESDDRSRDRRNLAARLTPALQAIFSADPTEEQEGVAASSTFNVPPGYESQLSRHRFRAARRAASRQEDGTYRFPVVVQGKSEDLTDFLNTVNDLYGVQQVVSERSKKGNEASFTFAGGATPDDLERIAHSHSLTVIRCWPDVMISPEQS